MPKTNPNGANQCYLCGYSKHVDRCHIIPKSICKFVEQLQEYKGFGNANIIYLCKNHHWELDHELLSGDDFTKVVEYILNGDKEFYQVFSYTVCGKLEVEEDKKYSVKDIKNIHKANKWIQAVRTRLDSMGFLHLGKPEFYKKYI